MSRILVVDDAANLRQLYRLELEAEGYEIIAAESGAKAIAILAYEKIDAIVLDLLLPDCPGLELMNEFLTRQRDIPLVINTAYEQFRDNFQTWGAEAFVVKSSDLSELKGVLRQVIARHAPNGKPSGLHETKPQPPIAGKTSNQQLSSPPPAALAQKNYARPGAAA